MARLLALSVLAVAAGCGLPEGEYFGPVPKVGDPRHLRWCNTGQPESLDPGLASSTTATPLVHTMFDGLTTYGADGLPEPSLATHWEIAPDQRRVTFHLRPEGRFSNGRPITAYDIAYQGARVLHPLTASPSADALDFLKGYEAFIDGSGKVLMRDAGGLPAGTIVDVVAVGGKELAAWRKDKKSPPDPNRRTGSRPLALRDLGAAPEAAYATVPVGTQVTLVELSGRQPTPPAPDGSAWAYVHWNRGNGVYGWVPYAELDGAPNAAIAFSVKPVARRQLPGVDVPLEELAADAKLERAAVSVTGADLLALPEQLGLRVPDPMTLVIEAATPTPHIVMTTPSRVLRAVPREAVARSPLRWAEPGTIVTSGPMHLTAMEERNFVEMVRSPSYWNRADVKLDKLTAYSLNDQVAAANIYYSGGCDATSANNVPNSYLPLLTGEARGGKAFGDFSINPYLGAYFLLVNTKKFDNVHLRRALALSIDRAMLPRILHGGEIGAASLTPGTPIAQMSPAERALCGVTADDPGVAMIIEAGKLCYVPPRGLGFDPERARSELALAKAELGDKFPRRVVYKFNSGAESHKLIAEYLQSQWKLVLGIDVSLESQEFQVFLTATRMGEFEIARMGWIASSPNPESDFMSLWRCASSNNRPKWCNPAYEALLDEAAITTDPAARLAKVKQAEALVLDEAPIIPLYSYTQKNLARPYVRDLAINNIAQPPLWRVWLDPDWRRRR